MIKYLRFYFLHSFIIFTAAITACTAESDLCTHGNQISIVNPDLKSALKEELLKNNISYQENNDGDLCYPSQYKDFVHGNIITLDLELRPRNHIKIAGGMFSREVYKNLTNAEIEFSHYEKNGEEILVITNENNIDEAVEIIDSTAMTMFNGK